MSDWFDKVNWPELETAYGTAEDIPDMLKYLAVCSKEEAIPLLFHLKNTVFHQFSIYASTAYVLEYFLKLIAAESVPFRARLLEFLGNFAAIIYLQHKNKRELSSEIAACELVLRREIDLYIQFLSDANASFRILAAFILTKLAKDNSDELIDLFIRQLETEKDNLVKAGLIFALSDLSESKNFDFAAIVEPLTTATSYPIQYTAIMLLAAKQNPILPNFIPFLNQAILNYRAVWKEFATAADNEDRQYHPIISTLDNEEIPIYESSDSASFPWLSYLGNQDISKAGIAKLLCKIAPQDIELVEETHKKLLNEESTYSFEEISYPILLYLLSETNQECFDTNALTQRQTDYLRAIYDNVTLWANYSTNSPRHLFKKLALPEHRKDWREILGAEIPPVFSSEEAEESIKRILAKRLNLQGDYELQPEHFAKIKRLELNQIANDTFVPYLYPLSELSHLNVQGSEMTGDGIARLPIFPKLTELYLGGIPLTEAAMQYISQLNTLQRLGLGTTGFKAEWLKYLIPLKELKMLLMGRGLPEGDIAKLKAYLPNCKIYI